MNEMINSGQDTKTTWSESTQMTQLIASLIPRVHGHQNQQN